MKDRVKKSIILIAVGIVINVALAIIKMHVGLSSNSLCIMLDATNSLLDIITCIVTLAFFIALLVPRNEKAPYGYGRGGISCGIYRVGRCRRGGRIVLYPLSQSYGYARTRVVQLGKLRAYHIHASRKTRRGIALLFCKQKNQIVRDKGDYARQFSRYRRDDDERRFVCRIEQSQLCGGRNIRHCRERVHHRRCDKNGC